MNGSCWREEQIMIAELSLARTGRPGRRRSMQNGAHPNDIHIHTQHTAFCNTAEEERQRQRQKERQHQHQRQQKHTTLAINRDK